MQSVLRSAMMNGFGGASQATLRINSIVHFIASDKVRFALGRDGKWHALCYCPGRTIVSFTLNDGGGVFL